MTDKTCIDCKWATTKYVQHRVEWRDVLVCGINPQLVEIEDRKTACQYFSALPDGPRS